MDDLVIFFWVLVAIAIVLGLITLLGHGIWLVLAAIFRAIFKLPKPAVSAPAAGAECVYCGAGNKVNFRFCGVCGRPAASEGTAERLRDLAATGRQIIRWVSIGTVDTESAERMHRLIRQERERLLSPGARPDPAPPVTSWTSVRSMSSLRKRVRGLITRAFRRRLGASPRRWVVSAIRSNREQPAASIRSKLHPSRSYGYPHRLPSNLPNPGPKSSRPSWSRAISAGARSSAGC
jgi:hypothetical protein